MLHFSSLNSQPLSIKQADTYSWSCAEVRVLVVLLALLLRSFPPGYSLPPPPCVAQVPHLVVGGRRDLTTFECGLRNRGVSLTIIMMFGAAQ